MALDLSKFSVATREQLLKIGRSYGSDDTIRQADITLSEYAKYGTELANFGFIADDAALLKEARDLLVKSAAGRASARSDKSAAARSQWAAMKEAKVVRGKALSIVSLTIDRLLLTADAAAAESLRKAQVVVQRSRASDLDNAELISQLLQLKEICESKVLADALKSRGGGALVTELGDAMSNVRAKVSSNQKNNITEEQTDQMDLLDGLIVQAVRNARKAGRAAAKALGKPAIADAFELTALYAHKTPAKEEPAPK